MSQALINPGVDSQDRWQQPCSTASHTSVWTWVGVFLAGTPKGREPQSGLGPAGLADSGETHIPAARQHGWSTDQGRSPLRAALAVPQLCSGHVQVSTSLSPDRPQYSASALPGMAMLLARMKADSSSTVLGDSWLYQAGRGQEEEKFPSCLGSGGVGGWLRVLTHSFWPASPRQ